MEIIFDPTKDKINIAKHGLSLADAVKLVWDEAQAQERADMMAKVLKGVLAKNLVKG